MTAKHVTVKKSLPRARGHSYTFLVYPLCILYIPMRVVPSPNSSSSPSSHNLLLGHVVLLLEQVTLDLRVLELLQVAICKRKNALAHISSK